MEKNQIINQIIKLKTSTLWQNRCHLCGEAVYVNPSLEGPDWMDMIGDDCFVAHSCPDTERTREQTERYMKKVMDAVSHSGKDMVMERDMEAVYTHMELVTRFAHHPEGGR